MALPSREALISVNARGEAAGVWVVFVPTVLANSEKAAARPGGPGLTSRIPTDCAVTLLLGPVAVPQTPSVVQPVPVQIEGYNEGSVARYLSISRFL